MEVGCEELPDEIRRALLAVDSRFARMDIRMATSIVDDLHLDSMRFADLTVALEDAFGIEDFSFQEWYDAEIDSEPPRFIVGSLLQACRAKQHHRAR